MPQKAKLLQMLSSASLYLGLFALVPYSFGDLANALPPGVKKYTAFVSLALAGITRFIALAINYLSKDTNSNPNPPTV